MAAIARSGVEILNLRIYSKTAGRGASSYDVTVGLPDVIEVGFAGVSWPGKEFALTYSTRVDHGCQ